MSNVIKLRETCTHTVFKIYWTWCGKILICLQHFILLKDQRENLCYWCWHIMRLFDLYLHALHRRVCNGLHVIRSNTGLPLHSGSHPVHINNMSYVRWMYIIHQKCFQADCFKQIQAASLAGFPSPCFYAFFGSIASEKGDGNAKICLRCLFDWRNKE